MNHGAEPMTGKIRTQSLLLKTWYFENQLMHLIGNQKTAGSNFM